MAKQSAKQKQQARSKHAAAVAAASEIAASVEIEDAVVAGSGEGDPDAGWEASDEVSDQRGEVGETYVAMSAAERASRWSVRVVDEEGAFYAFFLDESCAKKWLRRNPSYRLAVGEEGRAPRRKHEVVEGAVEVQMDEQDVSSPEDLEHSELAAAG